jgi:uncharacterized protein (DUF1778 family)
MRSKTKLRKLPAKQTRTSRFELLLTSRDRKLLEDIAGKLKIGLSQFIRQAALKNAEYLRRLSS